MKPFIKWAGGKSQLLTEIEKYLPNNFNNYIEPFLGGGALLLKLKPKTAIINDINSHLINTWKTIKNNLKKLKIELDKMIIIHNKEGKKYYLKIRKLKPNSLISDAARFLYLNKTCFNGLYRENNKGEFNVPYNNKNFLTLKSLLEENNVKDIHNYLKNNKVSIFNKDYKLIIEKAKKGDFIFIDPPYDIENNKQTFTKYSKNDFTQSDQIELSNILKKADEKGIYWMITNHNTELINDLYKNYNCKKVIVNRMINSNSSKRKKATIETIFWNYEIR